VAGTVHNVSVDFPSVVDSVDRARGFRRFNEVLVTCEAVLVEDLDREFLDGFEVPVRGRLSGKPCALFI
jgi:hypothetical protein